MRGFIAALYKDMKLMLNGTGLITLLFSLILLPLFWWGTKDLQAADVVRPFPIAVRDLDETFMSRSLITQIEEVELFSEVRVVGKSSFASEADEAPRIDKNSTDQEILATGVAGIVTIPKDFFYAMYRGEDCPVKLSLNDNMQLQAALLQSVFTSVMDIISADQSAWRGVYAYVYGENLTYEQQEALYEGASTDLFTDALSRQNVFESALSGSDLLGVFRRRLCAVLLMMLSILFSISALKTLPQEWNMGALTRYKAMGASLGGFIFSKLLTCIFWMLPMALLLFVLSGLRFSAVNAGLFALLTLLMLLASFSINLFFTAITTQEDGASRLSNMYLLLSLFFGGTLLSATLIAKPFIILQKLIAGAYALPVLNAMDTGEGVSLILGRMLPFLIISLVAAALAGLFAIAKRGLKKKNTKKAANWRGAAACKNEEYHTTDSATRKSMQNTRPLILRFGGLTGMKLILYAGGTLAFAVIMVTAVLSGSAARKQAAFRSVAVTVAVQDDDDTQASRELLELVRQKASDSVKLIPCKKGEGETLMVDLKVEGLMIIGKGYAQALANNAMLPLDYKSTASAFSAQAVREVFAGQVATQRALSRACEQAGRMRGEPLTEENRQELRDLITNALTQLPPIYQLSFSSGSSAPDPFVPDKMSFLAMTLILILMTAAAYTGRRDARAVTARLLGLRAGRLLTYGADYFALTLLGVFVSIGFLIPAGNLSLVTLIAAVLLSMNMAAFSLMITRFSYGAGRVDGLAPLFTLLICLLGGCFLDISSLSDTARGLMSLSPAGGALLFARAGVSTGLFSAGALQTAGVMLAETLVCSALGMRRAAN